MSYPSIFNDVLGPVMRGPSSSHCAASLRIGRLARDLMGGSISRTLIEYDPNGSLATTHESQGSDMGLFGGFLGWEAHDERLVDYREGVRKAGMEIEIRIHDIGAAHPNTYQMTLRHEQVHHTMIALSTGGGMLEVIEIDGAPVQMAGDAWVSLVYSSDPEAVTSYLKSVFPEATMQVRHGDRTFVEFRSMVRVEDIYLHELEAMSHVTEVRQLAPVLPVLTAPDVQVPFITSDEMLAYNESRNLDLWELALEYECARGGLQKSEVLKKARELLKIMEGAVQNGLSGTEYEDRILGYQSGRFRDRYESGGLVGGDVLNRIIMFVTAIMETKSSMGVIVAAPTAGSCGAMPGALLGTVSGMGKSEDEAVKALLAAGLIGVFISAHATFAAEVGGCQAECGAGAGMAAAAIVTLAGGTLDQCLSASSLALQNSLGMICDPIANRVEAPCLGKNVMAASNALSCANMALSDYDALIPLDQVIDTMDVVGKSIPTELRCTALGGLSITPASREIEARLRAKSHPEIETEMELPVLRFKSC